MKRVRILKKDYHYTPKLFRANRRRGVLSYKNIPTEEKHRRWVKRKTGEWSEFVGWFREVAGRDLRPNERARLHILKGYVCMLNGTLRKKMLAKLQERVLGMLDGSISVVPLSPLKDTVDDNLIPHKWWILSMANKRKRYTKKKRD